MVPTVLHNTPAGFAYPPYLNRDTLSLLDILDNTRIYLSNNTIFNFLPCKE